MIVALLIACLPSTRVPDHDGDGFFFIQDCNDEDPEIHVGADDVCDRIDNDCDGVVDPTSGVWYLDEDRDGWGSPYERRSCDDLSPVFVLVGGDCNDANDSVHPEAVEACTEPGDPNCDGVPGRVDGDGDGVAACEDCDDDDAAVGAARAWYVDVDGDDYGGVYGDTRCELPADAALASGDCDDADPRRHPGAAESCSDPADFDCDLTDGTFVDADGDGFPACLPAIECDDTRAESHLSAPELCNGFDDDCDGVTDEDDALDAPLWFGDADRDGYGAATVTQRACTRPSSGFTPLGGDCDEGDAATHPGAVEPCGPIDRNCDGSPGTADRDADGFRSCEECDDDAFDVHPGALETDCADPVDYNCDGSVGTLDGDADGAEACADCDDADGAVVGPFVWYEDLDADGFGDVAFTACLPPSAHWVASGGDCDDGDAGVFPGVGCP